MTDNIDLNGHIADEIRDACSAVIGRVVTFDASRQIAERVVQKLAALRMTPNPNPSPELREARNRLSDFEQMNDAQSGCVPCKLCGGKAIVTDAGTGAGYYVRCENSTNFRDYKGCMIDERRLSGWAYNVMDWWNRLHAQTATLPTDAQVREAMQTAWDDYCDDAKAFPGDLTKLSRGRIMFTAGTWADHTAMHLRAALSQTLPAPGEVERALLRAANITEAVTVVNREETGNGTSSWSEVRTNRKHNGQVAHCADQEDADLIAALINTVLSPSLATVAAANDEAFARGVEAAAKVAERWMSSAKSCAAAIRLLSRGGGK